MICFVAIPIDGASHTVDVGASAGASPLALAGWPGMPAGGSAGEGGCGILDIGSSHSFCNFKNI